MQQVTASSFLLGLLVSPLPVAIIFVLIAMFSGDLSETPLVVGYLVFSYVFVLVPLLISKGVLRLVSLRSLRAHFWSMFVVTFLPMLSVYYLVDFEPDAGFTYQLNDGETQVIEFAVAGVLLAVFMAFLNAACMLIFWRFAVRAKDNARESL